MRLGPEIDLVLIPMIAEEQHLAAVGDQHQRIVGKGHGIILSLGFNEENAGPSIRFQRLVAARAYSGSGSAGWSSSLSPMVAPSSGASSSPPSISISSRSEEHTS